MKKALLVIIVFVSLGTLCKISYVRAVLASPITKETNTLQRPARSVKGQVLNSMEMPALRLKFDGKFKYAGGHDFILYDVARAAFLC